MMSAPTRGWTRTFWNSSGDELARSWRRCGAARRACRCRAAAPRSAPPAPRARSCPTARASAPAMCSMCRRWRVRGRVLGLDRHGQGFDRGFVQARTPARPPGALPAAARPTGARARAPRCASSTSDAADTPRRRRSGAQLAGRAEVQQALTTRTPARVSGPHGRRFGTEVGSRTMESTPPARSTHPSDRAGRSQANNRQSSIELERNDADATLRCRTCGAEHVFAPARFDNRQGLR